ncbi:rRNA maturation RNase YbeY [Massilicoli timonensis]|uniref:rRNA maturation RNase YbeY n=1 Tax=Massilicoli timonensis TaxID=2015901 RepID=UPI000C867688|nr:rRNA maturation RNase YbeY [Massilicoli timonensis]HIR16016.1 rRNA maturation RNase YbeY [Candidatus Onthosoma merdavium]
MELTLINQLEDAAWEKQLPLLEAIMARCEQVLRLEESYLVSLVIVDDEQIRTINRSYRKIDKPTDVISFALKDQEDDYEMMEGERELGDIFINVDALKRQAEAYGHSEEREFGFLFTHGLLHLCGYDHMSEEQEREMFALQEQIIDAIIKR